MKQAVKNRKRNTQTVLITGASSGFGLEFAKLFAKDGYGLILTAKTGSNLSIVVSELEKEFSVQIWHKEIDLSQPEAAQKIFNWVDEQKLTVNALVNNAGIGLYGRFADHSIDEEKELINLNIVALSNLCHLFIPNMIKAGGGKILNISSIAGFQAGPYYATYFASKSYVLLFSEALYYEYAPDNITVTALCPGVARTDFFKRANMREDSRMLQSNLMEAEVVARAGYKGLMNNKRVVIPGVRNKVAGLGYRILPRSVINRITRNLIRIAGE